MSTFLLIILQFPQIKSTYFNTFAGKSGVPQGLNLGLVLFLIFVSNYKQLSYIFLALHEINMSFDILFIPRFVVTLSIPVMHSAPFKMHKFYNLCMFWLHSQRPSVSPTHASQTPDVTMAWNIIVTVVICERNPCPLMALFSRSSQTHSKMYGCFYRFPVIIPRTLFVAKKLY